MLTAVRRSDSKKVNADTTQQNEKPFECPECKSEVILKKGAIKIDHFAHKPPVNCQYGKGETVEHRKAKIGIYNAFKKFPSLQVCELEHKVGNLRPNIYVEISKVKIAYEIIAKTIGVKELIQKTEEYHKLGVYVLWMGIFNKNLNTQRYSIKAWEKWLHALYYGRVYYWDSSSTVKPVHFDKYETYVPQKEWYENGEHRSAGGFAKKLKNSKTPNIGQTLDLTKNFNAKRNGGFNSSKPPVPICSILLDDKGKWW